MPSKCTVVSTLPFVLDEHKPGLIPYRYEIPAATEKELGVLTVADGYHLYLVPLSDDKAPPMKIVDTAEKIAEGLCRDYIGASLAVNNDPTENGALSRPGLFWVEGDKSSVQVIAEHPKLVEQAKKNTNAWFQRMVRIADDDWQRTHQHRTISDLQRAACTYLRLQREWNFDVFQAMNNLCWACKASINPSAIICGSCKAILNVAEYEKNKARFVTT